eukprot:TRINITY_DN4689_c0_g1_i3.p1 TRINITY_DN4689_c0_g1~~TRINITY_DN4689_c0_g1_i3.p1  ORF type:complete len:137 (-),score=36.93 TRINITY_DN4689_c0_g1_i3:174-584(-)
MLVGLLGTVNIIGAGYLGAQLAAFPAGVVLPGFLGLVQKLYPALIAYAVRFVAAPAVSHVTNESKNKEIKARNDARDQWLQRLQSGDADGKLADARKYRTSMKQIGAGDSMYSTSKDASSQGASKDLDAFDRRLRS